MKKPIVLQNGVRLHFIPYTGTQAATVLALVKVGSRYEYPEINGASHFIEHLMFKGTKRRPTTLHISRDLDAVGAEYNAFTGKDYTGYYVTIDASHVPLAIDILHDIIFHSTYQPREMSRERRVIIEEIKMYHENPMMHVEELLEQAMFEGSSLGWDIAGTPQTMRAMKRKDVIDFRDRHYVPENIVLAVAGNVERKILPLIHKTFGRVASKKHPTTYEPFVTVRNKKLPRCRVEHKPLEQAQLAFGFPSFGAADPRNPAVTLLATILGGTMSSRLFISVRERKGLCYFVRAENSSYDEVGVFTIRSGLDRERLRQAVKTILGEIDRIKRHDVTIRELREAKENYRGRLLLRLEESSNQADWYARQELVLGAAKSPEERMSEVDAVRGEDVKRVANEVLDYRRMSVAAIGPFKDEQAFLRMSNIQSL